MPTKSRINQNGVVERISSFTTPMPKGRSSKKGEQAGTDGEGQSAHLSKQELKSMLLDLLRHDEEVKTCVAHIGFSRESDVFSGVVQCLKQGHSDINEAIGEISQLKNNI